MTGVDAYVPQHTGHRAALLAALASTPRLPRDDAMVTLALSLATMIDDAIDRLGEADEEDEARDFHRMITMVDRLSARYVLTLDRLGMSPGSRPTLQGGEGDNRPDPATSALERLQSESAGATPRQHPGAALDPAVAEALADD